MREARPLGGTLVRGVIKQLVVILASDLSDVLEFLFGHGVFRNCDS